MLQSVTENREQLDDAADLLALAVEVAALQPAGHPQVLGDRQRGEHALAAGHLGEV